MITEDYVSFETAKLLKEKGFDEDIARVVNEECEIDYLGSFQPSLAYLHHTWYRCPTLQMVMKWLREVHSLYLDIVTSFSQDGICYTFSCSNTMDLIQGTKGTSYHEYQTYEEACEAAIKYCLENLI